MDTSVGANKFIKQILMLFSLPLMVQLVNIYQGFILRAMLENIWKRFVVQEGKKFMKLVDG